VRGSQHETSSILSQDSHHRVRNGPLANTHPHLHSGEEISGYQLAYEIRKAVELALGERTAPWEGIGRWVEDDVK